MRSDEVEHSDEHDLTELSASHGFTRRHTGTYERWSGNGTVSRTAAEVVAQSASRFATCSLPTDMETVRMTWRIPAQRT